MTETIEKMEHALGVVERLGNLLRWVFGGVVAIVLWVATVNYQLQNVQSQISSLQSDRSKRIEDYDKWRTAKDVTDAKQDQILANQQQQIVNQQTLINLLAQKGR